MRLHSLSEAIAMNLMYKIISYLVALAAIAAGVIITYSLYEVPNLPELDYQKWWGTGSKPATEDTTIRPFRIDFNDTMVKDLKERLKNRRPFTKPMDGIQSEYGINTDYLNEKLDYWRDVYDFKKRAELLNKFPHFKTRIQGLDIHFVRVKPDVRAKKVLPLLLLHGWPSSSKEFDKVIPLLTSARNNYNFVFEVVAADLPGFGFSEGTSKPGLNSVQIGILMRNLMKRLGFDKFYVQAGDWGSQCASHMATLFPNEVLGYHTNMPLSSRPITSVKLLIGSLMPSIFEHGERTYPLSNLVSTILRESGYFHIQATKPDTVGAALTDTPVGLAAYLMEKIGVCNNRDQQHTRHGGLDELNIEDVLDTITIMWANNCITTATRIYAESVSSQWPEIKLLHNIPTSVPTAAINFRYEVMYQPDWMLRDKFVNLVRSTTYNYGGHFAALQSPKELVDDVFEATVEFLKFHSTRN